MIVFGILVSNFYLNSFLMHLNIVVFDFSYSMLFLSDSSFIFEHMKYVFTCRKINPYFVRCFLNFYSIIQNQPQKLLSTSFGYFLVLSFEFAHQLLIARILNLLKFIKFYITLYYFIENFRNLLKSTKVPPPPN